MDIIGILIAVLVVCVVIWAVRSLTSAFNVPAQLSTVILVVVVILLLLWFLGQAGIPLRS